MLRLNESSLIYLIARSPETCKICILDKILGGRSRLMQPKVRKRFPANVAFKSYDSTDDNAYQQTLFVVVFSLVRNGSFTIHVRITCSKLRLLVFFGGEGVGGGQGWEHFHGSFVAEKVSIWEKRFAAPSNCCFWRPYRMTLRCPAHGIQNRQSLIANVIFSEKKMSRSIQINYIHAIMTVVDPWKGGSYSTFLSRKSTPPPPQSQMVGPSQGIAGERTFSRLPVAKLWVRWQSVCVSVCVITGPKHISGGSTQVRCPTYRPKYL